MSNENKCGCGCGCTGNDQPQSAPASAPAQSASPAPEAPAAIPAYDPADELISIEDFMKVKLRTAQIISAEPHPNADKLVFLKLQVGTRQKQICAGIRKTYAPEQLVGKTIIIVDNLKPAKLRGIESQGMLLCASGENGPILLTTDVAGMPGGLEVK